MDSKKSLYLFFKSIFFGGLTIVFSIFITLYVMPIVISRVGIDAYGFVSLSTNIVSYLQIATIALNAYAARYISIAYLQKNYKEFNQFFNTVLWGNIGLGICILILFSLFSCFVNRILNVPNAILHDVQILFICVGINYFIGLLSVAWRVFAQIRDRVDIINLLDSISYLIQITILFLSFSFLNPHIWFIGFATLLSTLFVLIPPVILTRKLLPELQIGVKYCSKSSFCTLVVKGVWNSIDGLGNTLNSGLDLLVANLMLTPIAMGKVSVAKTIMALIIRLYSMVSQVFHPKYIKAYANNDMPLLKRYYRKSIRICSVVTNAIFACFLVLGHDFIRLWIPNQDTNLIFNLTILCLLPCLIEGMTIPLYSVYTLTTKLKIPTIVTIISGFINVLSMLLLLKYSPLGVYAIVITTAIIVTLAHFVTPFYSCKCLGIGLFSFIPTMIQCCVVLCCMIIITLLIGSVLDEANSWLMFCVNGLILAIASFGVGAVYIFLSQRRESLMSNN